MGTAVGMLENLDFGAIFFTNRSKCKCITDFYRASPVSFLTVGKGGSSAEDKNACPLQTDVTGKFFGSFSQEALLWPAFIVTSVEQLLYCWFLLY